MRVGWEGESFNVKDLNNQPLTFTSNLLPPGRSDVAHGIVTKAIDLLKLLILAAAGGIDLKSRAFKTVADNRCD